MCVLSLLAFGLLPTVPSLHSRTVTRNAHLPVVMGRKPGVSEPEQIKEFVAKAGANLIVVDARNTGAARPAHAALLVSRTDISPLLADFSMEPGDEATNAKAPIGGSVASPLESNLLSRCS